jgi:hypothetical protein
LELQKDFLILIKDLNSLNLDCIEEKFILVLDTLVCNSESLLKQYYLYLVSNYQESIIRDEFITSLFYLSCISVFDSYSNNNSQSNGYMNKFLNRISNLHQLALKTIQNENIISDNDSINSIYKFTETLYKISEMETVSGIKLHLIFSSINNK